MLSVCLQHAVLLLFPCPTPRENHQGQEEKKEEKKSKEKESQRPPIRRQKMSHASLIQVQKGGLEREPPSRKKKIWLLLFPLKGLRWEGFFWPCSVFFRWRREKRFNVRVFLFLSIRLSMHFWPKLYIFFCSFCILSEIEWPAKASLTLGNKKQKEKQRIVQRRKASSKVKKKECSSS